MSDTPQNPTDGKVDATPAPAVKDSAAPAPETKAPEQTAPTETPEKPLPGLSTEAPKKEAAPRPGAPEKYDWKIDGDPAQVESLTKKLEPMARKLGLSNDEVHGVYDTFSGIATSAKADLLKTWGKALEQDKEFGGDKLEDTLAAANSVVSQYGDDELRGLLDQAGLRHNPAIVRLLARVAQDVNGDRVPRVTDRTVGRSDPADAWYPTMKK